MEFEELADRVLTVTEVAKMWGKDRSTVMWAIWRDRVVAVQAAYGSIWLVDRASCVAYWGAPKMEVRKNG